MAKPTMTIDLKIPTQTAPLRRSSIANKKFDLLG
jgi:hypothetical protein